MKLSTRRLEEDMDKKSMEAFVPGGEVIFL